MGALPVYRATPSLFAVERHHVVHGHTNGRVRPIRSTLGRHITLAADSVLVERFLALSDTRTPGSMVADFRRSINTRRVAGRTHLGECLLAAGRHIRRGSPAELSLPAMATRANGAMFSCTSLRFNGSSSTPCPWVSAPIERATPNKMMAKTMRMPSTTLKELKKCVSEDSVLDTVTR
jgi:hypothetical protein